MSISVKPYDTATCMTCGKAMAEATSPWFCWVGQRSNEKCPFTKAGEIEFDFTADNNPMQHAVALWNKMKVLVNDTTAFYLWLYHESAISAVASMIEGISVTKKVQFKWSCALNPNQSSWEAFGTDLRNSDPFVLVAAEGAVVPAFVKYIGDLRKERSTLQSDLDKIRMEVKNMSDELDKAKSARAASKEVKTLTEELAKSKSLVAELQAKIDSMPAEDAASAAAKYDEVIEEWASLMNSEASKSFKELAGNTKAIASLAGGATMSKLASVLASPPSDLDPEAKMKEISKVSETLANFGNAALGLRLSNTARLLNWGKGFVAGLASSATGLSRYSGKRLNALWGSTVKAVRDGQAAVAKYLSGFTGVKGYFKAVAVNVLVGPAKAYDYFVDKSFWLAPVGVVAGFAAFVSSLAGQILTFVADPLALSFGDGTTFTRMWAEWLIEGEKAAAEAEAGETDD